MAKDKPTEVAEDAFQFAKGELQNVKTTLYQSSNRSTDVGPIAERD